MEYKARLSDEKGRISLGSKFGNTYFRLYEISEGRYVLEKDDSGDPPYDIPERALSYMKKFLDPNSVYREGATDEGYWEKQRFEDGQTKFVGGEPYKKWKNWPEGFSYEDFQELAAERAYSMSPHVDDLTYPEEEGGRKPGPPTQEELDALRAKSK